MSVSAKDFAAKVDSAYSESWGYIWGQAGAAWTQAKQDALKKKYESDPAKYSNLAKSAELGEKWVNHKVADCSGLPFVKLKEMGVKICHGSNSIWKSNLSHKGKYVKGMKLPVGAAIFTGNDSDKPHIGTLTSETCVTEAKGVQNGVVHTPLSNRKWTYWGLYKGVEYDFIPGDEIPDSCTLPIDVKFSTLRKGAKGVEVETLQTFLVAKGEVLPKYGADGKFGFETLNAVKDFQKKHGLVADGIVGPKTWAELVKG